MNECVNPGFSLYFGIDSRFTGTLTTIKQFTKGGKIKRNLIHTRVLQNMYIVRYNLKKTVLNTYYSNVMLNLVCVCVCDRSAMDPSLLAGVFAHVFLAAQADIDSGLAKRVQLH